MKKLNQNKHILFQMEYPVMLNYNSKENEDFYHNIKINSYLFFVKKICAYKNLMNKIGLIQIKYQQEHNL